MRPTGIFTTIAAGLVLGASQALAVPLTPGNVVAPMGTTVADPVHGGVQPIQNDNLIAYQIDPTPAVALGTTGGNVQNRVTLNQANTLNFAPRIRDTFNIDGGTFGVVGFSLRGFGSFDTDVDFRTDASGDNGYSSVSRSVDGDQLTFRFDSPLLIDALAPPAGPGRQQEGLFPSIVTDATAYDFSGSMTIVGQLFDAPVGAVPTPIGNSANDIFSVTITGLAVPKAAPVVPLPASSLLLLGGLGALAGLRRRRT